MKQKSKQKDTSDSKRIRTGERGKNIILDKDNIRDLELLDIRVGGNKESIELSLLRAILELQNKNVGSPISFTEIHEGIKFLMPGKTPSRTWVHRHLKELVDMKFINVEGTTRRKYGCDLHSIINGLAELRERNIDEIQREINELKGRKEEMIDIEILPLAENLFQFITGIKKSPTSRFLKGLDDFHRVTNDTIYNIAQEGDIIRTAIMNIAPYLTDDIVSRMVRLFDVAKRGVEVRYMIPPESLTADSLLKDGVPQQWLLQAIKEIKEIDSLKVRVMTGETKSYPFVSLNDSTMSFFVSDDPITAAWVTREFNPVLIDDALTNFDEEWNKAVNLLEMSEQFLERFGSSTKHYLPSLVEKTTTEETSSKEDEVDV